MQTPDEENIVFTTAANFINNSNHPVFLTGKAGTGKTTFLKFITAHSNKNTAVVAPTGVAAINAGGTTIHSFFQLPFAPFLPLNKNNFSHPQATNKNDLLFKLRLSSERKEVMQELELLVIDEISMVRCDVLDAIDTILRHVRNKRAIPFGGVQVLYIGDMYQLPPVVKEDEWQILRAAYENQFFFSSHVIISHPPIYIELKKVYRQTDASFISLLNKVRNNEMNEPDYALLHSRFQPDFKAEKDEGFITLTTHNNKADTINTEELKNINGPVFSFKASIEGEFGEKSFPADECLNIKTGSQVMFIKNDMEKVRRYYNGKIGVVNKIEEDKIWIECKTIGGSQLIEVKKETWRNIKYTLDHKTQQIQEQELGSFTQFPLRLAWAITIHKSQGLTFEKAIIDAGNAFASGQVYVALSRCTSLEGIVLKSKISSNSLNSDERIVAFSSKQQDSLTQSEILSEATRQYQEDLIRSLFDFTDLGQLMNDFLTGIKENNGLGKDLDEWLARLGQQINIYIQYSLKFILALDGLFTGKKLPAEDKIIKERLASAANWFGIELNKTKAYIFTSPAITDNRQLAKEYTEKLEKIFDNICLRSHLLTSCEPGFSLESYKQQKAGYKKEPFILNTYSGSASYISKDVLYPDLYNALKNKRDEICREKKYPVYMVCGTQSLEQMTNYLPKTLHELGSISGFGKIKLKQFGNDFITIVQDYCEIHNLETNIEAIPIKKIKKQRLKNRADTKRESFDLYKEGKTSNEIATLRNLALSTVEGHLAYFVETGELNINGLLDTKKQMEIKEVLLKTGISSLHAIKEHLPDISFGELKWMVAFEKKLLLSGQQ